MKINFAIIFTFLVFVIFSCKKDSGNKNDTNQFTFTYNGVVYNAAVNNNLVNAAAINVGGAPGIFIDMPSVFGGQIFFIRNGCAYLETGSDVINVTEPNCQLSIQDNFGNPQPIDSVKVYIYRSGTLNISFSECKVKSSTDPWTGATHQYQVCRAKGTFELTLINKNQQQLKITNGKVDQTIQF
jgi:hypothetical protein